MEIKLFGTGAAEGWPGLFCNCRICTEARVRRGKNIRTRSSALIDGIIKLDLPPDTMHHAIRFGLNLTELQGLLFTHAHDDHLCATELQYLGPWFVQEARTPNLKVFGPPAVISRIESEIDLDRVPITLVSPPPFETFTIEGYEITPLVANHDPAQVCYNYIIKDPKNASLLYASDTGWYTEETWRFLEGITLDGLIVECTNGPTNPEYTGHMGVKDVIRMRERLINSHILEADSVVVATHFSHQGGATHEELEAMLCPQSIITAFDGINFSITSRGKRISSRTAELSEAHI